MKKFYLILIILVVIGLVVWWPKHNKLTVISDQLTVKTEQKKEIKNKIAIMADIHNDLISLNKAVELAKSDGADAIIIAGDLTINGTREELLEVMAHLGESGMKYLAVPGNHDLYKSAWSGVFGKEYQSVRIGSDKYILINNANWRGLGEAQKQWLLSELPECKVIKCLAVMHEPIENSFSKHVMGEYSATTAAEGVWLKKILLENNVTTGYSGHLHYSSEYTNGDWNTVLVGAISKDRNTETPRFTEISAYDDGSIVNEVRKNFYDSVPEPDR